jgi:catechol 2,3-dioxygenase-like lactoylglutathione lyase family enzyme
MLNIQQLSSITLRTDKLKECNKFYDGPWGLELLNSTGNHSLFRGLGTIHHVLELIGSNESGLEKISFTVEDEDAVNQASEKLLKHGFEPNIETLRFNGDVIGIGFMIQDPDGNNVQIHCDLKKHQELNDVPNRINKLDHLVLNTPNVIPMIDFYSKILGFRISDWYEKEILTFLTCNDEHHCLAIAKADVSGIQHIAFEVKGLDALMRGIGKIKKFGYDPIWGPGRHAPGGNVFSYFADPNGYVVELTCDQFEIDQHWEAKEWIRTLDTADMWGTAGAPSGLILKLWSGDREEFELKHRDEPIKDFNT